MPGRLPTPSSIPSFSCRRKRRNQEKGGRPKLPFLWECLSWLNGRNSLRSNKTPIFYAMPFILIVRQAAQPVIPVTGRLENKYKQLQMSICWKIYLRFHETSDKSCLNKLHTQISLCLLIFFCQICFLGDIACSIWRTTPTITGATVAPACQTKGLRKKRLCWQQLCDFFRSAPPPRQAYNRLVSPLAGKGAGVLVGGFFLFGTFSFWPRRKKKYIAYVSGTFTNSYVGQKDIPLYSISLFRRLEKEWTYENLSLQF